MKYVSVQPDHSYFWWQVETYVHNFCQKGVDPKDIHVVYLYGNSPSYESSRILVKYPQVNIHHFRDTRLDRTYIPSIKPFGMNLLLSEFPQMNEEPIFYHDSDIIFTSLPDWSPFEADNKWWGSNCGSYLGPKYVISKGVEQFVAMSKMIGIDPAIIKSEIFDSIGAQLIIKGTDAAFWKKVTKDSDDLYRLMLRWTQTYQAKGLAPHPIQAWTAEMWSTLWNAWLYGHETRKHWSLDFSFATDTVEKAKLLKIMHNAGVTGPHNGQFYKGDWRYRDPREHLDQITVNESSASWLYYQALIQSAELFKLL